jgi:hypothetical protein
MLKDQELVARYGLEGKFVAGYIGTHGMAHALETLLKVAEKLQTEPTNSINRDSPLLNRALLNGDGANALPAPFPDFYFLFLGDGARKQELIVEAHRRGLDNVLFLDSVPKEEVVRYWSLLDVSIIHLRKTELFTTVIPSKLFESMGMGIPVLLGVAGESAEIVEKEGVGLTFEPENAGALCDALLQLRDNPDLYGRIRNRCIRAAGNYDRETQAASMLSHLNSHQESASNNK